MLLLNLHAKLPHSGKMQVDRPQANFTAARCGQACLAHPRQNRAEEYHGRAHLPHQMIWDIGAFNACGIYRDRVALPLHLTAEIGQNPDRRVYICQPGAVMYDARLIGQNGSRKNRQGAIFRAVYPQLPAQALPAFNDDFLHCRTPFRIKTQAGRFAALQYTMHGVKYA